MNRMALMALAAASTLGLSGSAFAQSNNNGNSQGYNRSQQGVGQQGMNNGQGSYGNQANNDNQGYNNNSNQGYNGNNNQGYKSTANGGGNSGYNRSQAQNNGQGNNGNQWSNRNQASNGQNGNVNQAELETPNTQIRLAQVLLSSMGLYNGAIDGLNGQNTSQAIAQFQSREQLRQTGQLDPATLNAVRRMTSVALMGPNGGMQNGRAASESEGGSNGDMQNGNMQNGGMQNDGMQNQGGAGGNNNGNP